MSICIHRLHVPPVEHDRVVDKDPLSLDPVNGNFSLLENSPCIDSGDPSSTVPYGGGCRIDMGTHEFYKGFNCLEEETPIPSWNRHQEQKRHKDP